MVDKLVPSAEVLNEAKRLAGSVVAFGEKKAVYQQLKDSTYHEEIALAKAAEVPEDEIKIARRNRPKL